MRHFIFILWLVAVSGNISFAQTTGGVFGPNISAGDHSVQFRAAMSPAENNGETRWESRIHYQQAFSENWRGRIVLQGSDIETGTFESNFIQAELQWQLKKADDMSSWATAVRFDARLVEEDDGASRLGINWTNQWNPNGNWQFNNVILVGTEIGPDAGDGLILELRNGIKYRLENGHQIGVESFSVLGRSNALGGFNSQNHRLGPVMTGKVTENTSFLIGALFGASDAARDVDFRLWLGHRFQ